MKKTFTFLFVLTALLSFAQTDTWCGTTVPDSYRTEYWARDRSNYAAINASRTGIQWVGVYYHIITKDDGSGGVGLRKIFESHCELNVIYNQFNIGFYIKGIDTVKNTTLWNYQNQFLGYQAFQNYNVDNCCNIYMNGNLPGLCGFATFPNTAPNGGGVFINATDCIGTATTTLPHEVGHYFGLLHTFDDGNGVEYVDGSNCNTAGDGFCDTPADFLDQRTPCPYTGNQTDPHGDLYSTVIDETLYMSYFSDNCVNRFSPMEEAEMNSVLVSDRPNLLNQTLPDLSQLDTAHFITPINGDSTILGNTLTIKWNAIPLAKWYMLRIQSGTSSIVYADTVITDTTFILTGLNPGKSYKYKVKGISYGNTCSPYTTYNIVKTSVIKPNAAVLSPSCQGQTNASVTLAPSNGTAPYSVNWSNGSTGNSVTNLASGTYTYTVTDAAGNSGVGQIVIADPVPVSAVVSRVGNNLNATGSGGTAPYTYSWSNGQTGPFNNNVGFGSYSVTVTDSKGCTAEESFIYSSIGVEQDLKVGMKVFPNPVEKAGMLNVQIDLNESKNATLSLINVNGEVLREVSAELHQGSNTIALPMSQVAAGIYYVRFSSDETVKTVRISVLR
ncbi:MAG: T9SS type A sorting domain-containing protein [Chitinophagales bacterium]